MNMNILANLKFNGSNPILEHASGFPENPQDGTLALVKGIVYMYTHIGGMLTWYPLTNEKNYFVHAQGLASTEWNIIHNMHTTDMVFFAYDSTDTLMTGTHVPVDGDRFKIKFTSAVKGKVVVFAGADALNVEKNIWR